MATTDMVLVCGKCHNQNVVARVHSNMLARDGVQTFCARCNSVTQHRVAGSPGGFGGYGGSSGQPSPSRTDGASGGGGYVDDGALWSKLEQRLRSHNLNMEDVRRADTSTRGRLFGTLGFDASEEQRLQSLASQRLGGASSGGLSPNQPNAFGVNTASPSASGPNWSGGGGSTMGSPYGGMAGLNQSAGATNANQRLLDGTSSVPGLSFEGDNIIARCSVFPNQPAEFWCCACNVLVSSRCHVQGIHKDHPFITLRLAAEAHIRDVTAWNERCRTQLNVISSVLNNLKHADHLIVDTTQKEYEALDDTIQTIINDLMRWKEQLKQDITSQVATQKAGIQHSITHTEGLFKLYSDALGKSEPLMVNIPPVEATDKSGEEWALRVLDLVSKLKHVNAEAIPMPKVAIPRVTSNATPSTHMELVKCVSTPLGVRLPDLLDPGYFNFPNPSVSARLPFTLSLPEDASSKGIQVYNGRTLTRAQDVVPSHHLVLGSQVFYGGSTSWEVHIDRLGNGPGRVLAGITVNGSDGEGVVWDGLRIVGPNEGECRTLDERYAWRPGTVLRFHLELDPPSCHINCFFDRDGVARIPLPANGHGWVPAFSVFGPQDQVTIVPTSSQQQAVRTEKRSAALAAGDTVANMERQEALISSLQQQLNAVNTRVDSELYRSGDVQAAAYASPPPRPDPQYNQRQQALPGQRNPSNSPTPNNPGDANFGNAYAAPTAGGGRQSAGRPADSARRGTGFTGNNAYSPELRQLMRYVDDT